MAVETLIFVDVDGVLNVGARDDKGSPLLLSEGNVDRAFQPHNYEFLRVFGDLVVRVAATAERCPELTCPDGCQLSGVLVERLASIVQAADARRSVVLSSNWRKPKNARRVARLEDEVSQRMGTRFKFDATTEIGDEAQAQDRLKCIGKYVKQFCAKNKGKAVRILILDDLFVTPLDGWTIGGKPMREARDVEAHVRSYAPKSADVRVKFVHCYDEWDTKDGVRVQIGAGIAEQDVQSAKAFLAAPVAAPAPPRPPSALKHPSFDLSWLILHRDPARKLSVKDEELDALHTENPAASAAVCCAGLMTVSPLLCLV